MLAAWRRPCRLKLLFAAILVAMLAVTTGPACTAAGNLVARRQEGYSTEKVSASTGVVAM